MLWSCRAIIARTSSHGNCLLILIPFSLEELLFFLYSSFLHFRLEERNESLDEKCCNLVGGAKRNKRWENLRKKKLWRSWWWGGDGMKEKFLGSGHFGGSSRQRTGRSSFDFKHDLSSSKLEVLFEKDKFKNIWSHQALSSVFFWKSPSRKEELSRQKCRSSVVTKARRGERSWEKFLH